MVDMNVLSLHLFNDVIIAQYSQFLFRCTFQTVAQLSCLIIILIFAHVFSYSFVTDDCVQHTQFDRNERLGSISNSSPYFIHNRL